jgi:hypothetical protein
MRVKCVDWVLGLVARSPFENRKSKRGQILNSEGNYTEIVFYACSTLFHEWSITIPYVWCTIRTEPSTMTPSLIQMTQYWVLSTTSYYTLQDMLYECKLIIYGVINRNSVQRGTRNAGVGVVVSTLRHSRTVQQMSRLCKQSSTVRVRLHSPDRDQQCEHELSFIYQLSALSSYIPSLSIVLSLLSYTDTVL